VRGDVFVTANESYSVAIYDIRGYSRYGQSTGLLTPYGFAADDATNTLYVADYYYGSPPPYAGAVLAAHGSDCGSAPVAVYQPGVTVNSVAFDAAASLLYVTQGGAFTGQQGAVAVLDTAHGFKPVANFAVSYWPYGVALDAAHQRLYVTDQQGGAVNVYSTASGFALLARITGLHYPEAVAVDPVAGRLYVSNSSGANVYSTAAGYPLLTTVGTSIEVVALALDTVNGRLYLGGTESACDAAGCGVHVYSTTASGYPAVATFGIGATALGVNP